LILSVVLLTTPEQAMVKVSTGVVMERVIEFFEDHPGETLEAVITKKTARGGRQYWVLLGPDQYERQQAQPRTVLYPTRQERLVRPTDVAANDDKIEHIPF
jgi:hypothetical protein